MTNQNNSDPNAIVDPGVGTQQEAQLSWDQEASQVLERELGRQVNFNDFIQEAKSYESKLKEFQERRFANDLVAKINTAFESGEPVEKITTYFNLAKTDLNTLSAYDAIRMNLELSGAGYTREMIEALIEENFGLTPDVDEKTLSPLQQAKIVQARQEAVQALQGHKSSYEPKVQAQPDPAAQQLAAAQAQQLTQYWHREIQSLPGEIKISAAENKEIGMPAYEFTYKAAPELLAQVNQIVVNEVKNNPAAFPPDEQGRNALTNLYNIVLNQLAGPDMQQKMVHDIWASLAAQAKNAIRGPIPTAPNLPPAQSEPVTGRKGVTLDDVKRFNTR